MRVRTIFVMWIAWAGLAGAGGRALAQEAADASLAEAEKYFHEAQTLFGQARYQEAAQAFEAAHAARPLPPFLYNVGACYEKLAKSEPAELAYWDQAIEHYREYIEAAPEAEDREAIEGRIEVLTAERDRIAAAMKKAEESRQPAEVTTSSEVESLEEAAIRGLVVIESDPPGATVYLDDTKKDALGRTPWSGTLEGEHTVYIEHKGYEPREMSIAPSPDKLIVLSVALAEVHYLGWIEITSNVPGADIYIDDKSVGVYRKTPFSGNLPPGKHEIWITAEGYDEHHQEVEIVAGKTQTIAAHLKGAPVGYLDIHGRDIEHATIYLDGEVLCERGPCRKAVRRGAHELVVRRPGYKPYRRSIDMQPQIEMNLRVSLAKIPGRGDAVWAYIFAAAFAGGGVYLGLEANQIRDDLRREIDLGMPPPDSDDPRFLRGKLMAVGADVGYALAGVSLATAVYYTFRDKGAPSTGSTEVRTLAVEPRIEPGYAGIGMEVSW